MKIFLYSTNCPKCKILKSKLQNFNMEFEEINDVDLMISKGFTAVPILEVEGKCLNFKEAVDWINNYEH